MTTAERFDLKMTADEKAVVAKAAALMGTTMTGFVRAAAKERAQFLLERETRLAMTDSDFTAFARALDSSFAPNPALKQALTQARRNVRRAGTFAARPRTSRSARIRTRRSFVGRVHPALCRTTQSPRHQFDFRPDRLRAT